MATSGFQDTVAILLMTVSLAVLCTCQSHQESDLLVSTTLGTVRGFRKTAIQRDVIAFLGIPYAEPPVGSYRFKPPVRKTPWNGEHLANQFGMACNQYIDMEYPDFRGSEMWNSYNQSEDCLTISVWIPSPRIKNTKLAVMVWIYGGGFYSGSTSLGVYDGAVLSAYENIIVVSLNYRVSLFGFLAFGTTEAPGNVGLLDQHLALQWINENIENFGGDKNRITLFGESAGAASISFHIVSSQSEGLFHRAIMQSGSFLSPWARVSEAEGQKRGLQLAQRVGCMDADSDVTSVPSDREVKRIVSCLRKKSPEELLRHEWVVDTCFRFPFVPIVDGKFIVELPEETLRRQDAKRTDLMLGINTNEGSFFMPYSIKGFSKDTDSLINKTILDEAILNGLPNLNSFSRDAVAFMYTDWLDPHNPVKLRDNMESCVGDYNVKCPVYAFAKYMSEAENNVYFYHFNQRSANNEWAEWMGVLHGDEIMYVFGDPLHPERGYSEDDKLLSIKMMKLWANFGRTGNPNNNTSDGRIELVEAWPTFTKAQQNVYRLKEESGSGQYTETWDKANICAFWSDYLPDLNTQTADINDAEKMWKEEFHQWSTKYMVDWKAEFNHYIYKKKENNHCGESVTSSP